VVKIFPEWVTGPQQGNSSGRIATFSLWTGMFTTLGQITKQIHRLQIIKNITNCGQCDSSMCPGVDSASQNEYQVNPEGKVGRCVRLTTYNLHVPMSKNLGALTSWNPVDLFRPFTNSGQIVGIQEKLDTACKQNAS
jgi:hypothetical protein